MDKTGKIQGKTLDEAAMMHSQSSHGINPLVFSLVDLEPETNHALYMGDHGSLLFLMFLILILVNLYLSGKN
ncbi:hypothetical protein E2C01_064464 [Portunus trituberculatus]|uniref:Uncharacterized protein n=1 Tax=Portunus trituberculatus TaxID=210409 RepID=A0A5B7HG86_PORTR|nr:hypothetical protein [Portunus trituberculatus]